MTNKENKNQKTFDEKQSDASNWKLGIFYFNKNDKRLFPPKRIGIGWTINFANPMSVLALVGISAIVIVFTRYLAGRN